MSSPKFGANLGTNFQRALGGSSTEADLTVRDVAARLRVSTATVYLLCRRGELEHHRISHAIRVLESAFAKYLEAARSPARPEPHSGQGA